MTNLLPPAGTDNNRDIATAVNQALKGKINSVGSVTLAHDATSTTVENALVSKSSFIDLSPQTAHAAAELGNGTAFIAPGDITAGVSFKITHANNAQTDRDFVYVILG